MRGRRAGAVAALLVLAALAGACDAGGDDSPGPDRTAKPAKVGLTFGVWGQEDEIATYQSVVDTFNSLSPDSRAKIDSYSSDADLESAVQDGDAPDVFLISRADLAGLLERRQTKPLGDLLDDRGVDFGDGYSRTALEAFSLDRNLQCMPWGISPQVVFYNRSLVNFDAMAARGLPVPSDARTSWSFEDFTAAARYAARARKGIAGVYVDPTLRGLAPFVFSGGGSLFDDDQSPTSLDFSSGDTQSALSQVLPVLTDPSLTLTAAQLAEKTPLEWFEEGKLGMIMGYRSLVPQLRQVPSLDWDVIAMPSLASSATAGDLTALCISSTAKDAGAAADLVADLVSTDSVRQIVRAGYLAPANSTVALSDDFLQPGRAPTHAAVFNNAVKAIQPFPLLPDYDALNAAEAPLLQQLLQPGGTPDLATLGQSIDDTSAAYLSPPSPSASPSDTPSASDGASDGSG